MVILIWINGLVLALSGRRVVSKSPLTPLCQREELSEASLCKGRLGGISERRVSDQQIVLIFKEKKGA